MFEISVHPVPDAVRQRAYLNDDDYQRLYRQSVENPDEFWASRPRPSSIGSSPGTASTTAT